MIIDARQLPEGETLNADLCIIGAGPAGITLAHEMIGLGLSIILAEGGRDSSPRDLSPMFAGEVVDSRHGPLELFRSRCLGGTSSIWGGRCVPLDAIDFTRRDWVPYSGWPITRRQLEPSYRRAMAYCEAGRFSWRVTDSLPDQPPEMIPGLHDEALRTDSIERFSLPTDFGKSFRDSFARADKLQLLLNANCLNIGLSAFGRQVEVLNMASAPGRNFNIQARAVVLAAGGLETTRLLLLSDDVLSEGIGNHSNLLGRFYMCHVEGKVGVVRLDPEIKGVVHGFETDADGVYCRRRLSISEETQQQRQLMNMIARFEHPTIANPDHHNGILSAMYMSRTFLKKEYALKIATFGLNGAEQDRSLGLLAAHLRNMMADAPTLLRFSADWFRRRNFARRKLPFVIIPNRNNRFHLDYNAEQSPNPASRISLISERDPFGRRRLKVDWRTSAQDHDNVSACYRLIRERLHAHNLGDLAYDEEELRGAYNAVGGHHMGTTRMADFPGQGVVDANGKVFGVDNLFVASSSTFPTSGHANPTLTVVAMALRLGEHLGVALRQRWPEHIVAVVTSPPASRPPSSAAGTSTMIPPTPQPDVG